MTTLLGTTLSGERQALDQRSLTDRRVLNLPKAVARLAPLVGVLSASPRRAPRTGVERPWTAARGLPRQGWRVRPAPVRDARLETRRDHTGTRGPNRDTAVEATTAMPTDNRDIERKKRRRR